MPSTWPIPSAPWRRTASRSCARSGTSVSWSPATTAAAASAIDWRSTIPRRVSALIPVDIVPTAEAWRRTTADRAIRAYHWAFLAQPYPLPERLIGKDPVFYLEHTLKSWARSGTLAHFSAEALAHYRALLQEPERVHAVCEDYRAGATIDWQHDEADMAAGRKIACPTFLLWGSHYLGRGGAKPLEVWRTWCSNELSGAEIESGHFLAEENPEATLAALLPFLAAQRDMR